TIKTKFYDYLLIKHYTPISLITRAGFPPTTTFAGTFFVTTAPDAITALSPTVTPGLITARPPIQTLFPIVTGLPNSFPAFRSTGSRGCVAVQICTPGASIQLAPMRISQTPSITQSKLA